MGSANVLEQTGVIKAKLVELEEFKQSIQSEFVSLHAHISKI